VAAREFYMEKKLNISEWAREKSYGQPLMPGVRIRNKKWGLDGVSSFELLDPSCCQYDFKTRVGVRGVLGVMLGVMRL